MTAPRAGGSCFTWTPGDPAGAFFGVTSVFAGEHEAKQSFSATSIDFGVALRGRYALR